MKEVCQVNYLVYVAAMQYTYHLTVYTCITELSQLLANTDTCLNKSILFIASALPDKYYKSYSFCVDSDIHIDSHTIINMEICMCNQYSYLTNRKADSNIPGQNNQNIVAPCTSVTADYPDLLDSKKCKYSQKAAVPPVASYIANIKLS